jgi:lipoprotein-anchoring transpeptidase ErfK/SrfK
MIEREPELAKWSAANGGMPPGLDNPLGARALYIFEGGEDTLYRLHGTPEYWTIGKAVSSGCVRLMNQDIIDLYDRVPSGARLIVT